MRISQPEYISGKGCFESFHANRFTLNSVNPSEVKKAFKTAFFYCSFL